MLSSFRRSAANFSNALDEFSKITPKTADLLRPAESDRGEGAQFGFIQYVVVTQNQLSEIMSYYDNDRRHRRWLLDAFFRHCRSDQ